MTLSTLPLEKITDLLNGLKSLPPSQKREPTFMEITGYPHFENVCSNILQFYLQPSNEHGFGTLLLDSLFTLINEKVIINGQNIDIRREESTAASNRMDLVIKSDDFILGIENKLFAYEDRTPFEDYAKHLDNSLPKVSQVYKVILSLRPIKEAPSLHGFKPITYALFFQKVIENISSYFLTAREPHITFLRDFIQTIQNLQRETPMDQQRLTFFHENQHDLVKLLAEVDALRKDMREKVKQSGAIIADEVILLPFDIDSGIARFSDLRDFLWYTVKTSDSLWLQIDFAITPLGWRTRFFYKRNGGINDVKQWVTARAIQYEILPDEERLIYRDTLPYETKPEFDQKFDDGEEDIIKMLDLSKAKRPLANQKRLSIDLPIWMIELIDQEANRLGITPQKVIQDSLAEHLAVSTPSN